MTHETTEVGEKGELKFPLLPRWWRVLPAMVLMMIISSMDTLMLNDFVEYRYSNFYQMNSTTKQLTRDLCLNASASSYDHDDRSPTSLSTTTWKYPVSSTTSVTNIVQSSTARLNVFIALAATLPAVFTSILLGANCDHIGRKPLIALPFLGKTFRYMILTAVAYYELADWWIILSVTLDGLFGTGGLLILSSFAFVTDCTTDKARTPATIITEVCIVCTRVIPLLTLGFYLEQHHFVIPMLIALMLSLIGFVFSIVLQPESNTNVQHLNFIQQLARVRPALIKNIFQVFFVKREGNKRQSLLITVIIHLGFIVMLLGNASIMYLYMYGPPYCFDSLGASLNSVSQTVSIIVLTIPFTLTLAKRTDNMLLPMIGCLALMGQYVLFGTARFVWMLYLGVCLSAIYYVTGPIIRSRITKLVEPNEYAVVFILASVFESAGFYAISAMSNEIYRLSLTFDSGLIYFVLAIVGLLPLSLMIYVFVTECRSNPTPKILNINVDE